MTTIPYIKMTDGDDFFPRDRITLSIEESRLGGNDTGDGVVATFPFLSTDPIPLRIAWIEQVEGRIICERDGTEEEYVHMDETTFVRYANEGRIVQMTRPLYEGPHRFINRWTELEERILFSTPRRDTTTRQFGYLIESRRAQSVEHLFITEKQLLNRAKPSAVQPEGANDD